jgi:hypothetical protein
VGRLRRFLSRRVPKLNHVLFIESGDREVSERMLPALYSQCPYIDIVTCYGDPPAAFARDRGAVFNTAQYQGRDGQKRLAAELWTKHYSAVGIICAESPILFKWKWFLATQLPGKLFIVNENVDYFWVDRGNWHIVRKFVLYRLGLSGADAARTLTQLALFPFTVLWLLLFAAWVHTRRFLRTRSAV